MLSHAELVALHRSLSGEHVLSVYIDGTSHDPAAHRSWRLQLEKSLNDLRLELADVPHEEREEFDRCIRFLEARLEGIGGAIGAPGWAAFVSSDGVREAHRVPTPPRTQATWTMGPNLAPYMRTLVEGRPVVVAVADARRVVLSQYRMGELHRIETIRAHHVVEPPLHMGTAPRQGFHTGTRGAAGRDAAQRALLQGRNRMLAQTAKRIAELTGSNGWIVLGGIHGIVKRLSQRLAPMKDRLLEIESLDVHAPESEIVRAARDGAARLREAEEVRRVALLEEQAGAHGLAVIGSAATRRALEQASCRELLVTHQYLAEHAADADEIVRAALDQDATVEEVSGEAAVRLDAVGGMAAGLRFRPPLLEASGQSLAM